MRFNVRPFRHLQWQLSLSYTLVVVVSLLAIELLIIGGGLIFMNSNFLPNLLVAAFREQFSVNLRAYLDRPQPDLKGMDRYLSAYLNSAMPSSTPHPNVGVNTGVTQAWNAQEATQNMAVIDPQGRLLWAQTLRPGWEIGQKIDPETQPGLMRVLPAALADDPVNSHLYVREGNRLVMAIPLVSEESAEKGPARVLAVMTLEEVMPSFTNPTFVLQLLPTLLVSLLAFTLFGGLVGSLFGFITARGLTNRLARVQLAANAWSQGDFSILIPDQRDDEMGDLARRLNAMAEQLRHLMETRQALAAMEERNRIARDLHDSVKQQIFAAAMQLGAAHALLPDEASPAAQRLAEAEQLTRQAQNELTALIRELRPVALEGKGLERALRELTSDWSRQTGITATLDTPATPAGSLPAPQEQALYRITQEALANVARHSQAHSVRVTYTRVDGQASLTVQDDGAGFDPRQLEGAGTATVSASGDGAEGSGATSGGGATFGSGATEGGVGLKSMRERVAAMNGRMEIESLPGRGTKLTIILPVK